MGFDIGEIVLDFADGLCGLPRDGQEAEDDEPEEAQDGNFSEKGVVEEEGCEVVAQEFGEAADDTGLWRRTVGSAVVVGILLLAFGWGGGCGCGWTANIRRFSVLN